MQLTSDNFNEDGIATVSVSPRPLDHASYFTGSSDDGLSVGGGNKLLFNMADTDVTKSVDMVFNEDVYLKDGYMIVHNAPFGASIDIEIVHPAVGHLMYFGRDIPVLGSGFFPLDTEDKAYIPVGLIIRTTVNNASGIGDEDPAAAFKVAGRLEMYRRKPEGV